MNYKETLKVLVGTANRINDEAGSIFACQDADTLIDAAILVASITGEENYYDELICAYAYKRTNQFA